MWKTITDVFFFHSETKGVCTDAHLQHSGMSSTLMLLDTVIAALLSYSPQFLNCTTTGKNEQPFHNCPHGLRFKIAVVKLQPTRQS